VDKFFLLADDDHDDAELFGEALAGIIPRVDFHHVEDGQAVFRFLNNEQNRKPDIIFLDINMPEISGWQCLTKLKSNAEYRNIPVIMYTTSSASRDKEIAIELGASGLLTKPTNFKTLVKVLNSIVHIESTDLKRFLQETITN
jgi:CheY-like chemotaxis protein